MKLTALVILMINSYCAFSQILHEVLYVVGCFENGTTQVQAELDAEEILHVDFDRQEVVYTVPRFLIDDPSKLFENLHVFKNAIKARKACKPILDVFILAEKNPPEKTDPPENVLYPADDVQLGVENSLVCFVNHFYPPQIKVSWTRNGHQVSEGVSLSRYYPNNDQTFHQFSTLTFTPRKGDVYSCTVEHMALDRPQTKIWESNINHHSLGLDVYCGVGLTVGLLGVAAGTFLMVKGYHRQLISLF